MENVQRQVEEGVIMIKLTTIHLMPVALNADWHSKIKAVSIHCLFWKEERTVFLSVNLHSPDRVNAK